MTDSTNTTVPQLPIAQAALRLRRSWTQTYRLLLIGQLRGEQRGGRWFVAEEDVEQLAKSEQQAPATVPAA